VARAALNNAPAPAPQHGFTLVEVLLALSIAAVIAVIAYQALSAASGGAERTRTALAEINQLDRAWQIIAADLHQVLPPSQGSAGVRFEFMGSSLRTSGATAEQLVLMFSRGGWANPLERLRSDMQQVAYRVNEGQLWRDFLPERNLAPEEIDFEFEAFNQLLLENVEDIQLRFLSREMVQSRGRGVLDGDRFSDAWAPEWPPLGGPPELPLAVEITIHVTGLGASVRLFEISQPSR
jgi:general secretion pathway protein J